MTDIHSTSMINIMKQSMDLPLTKTERSCLYESAISHRDSLLDGVSFLGELLKSHAAEARTQPNFGRDDFIKLGEFLSSTAELVQCMDGIIDSYEP